MTIDPRMAQRRRSVAEQRVRGNLRRLMWVLSVAGAVAAVVWLFRSPFLSVERVEVTGVVASSTDAALVELGAVPGTPLISISEREVEARLEEDPRVVEASVRRQWPDTLIVEIVERSPVAWVVGGSGAMHVAPDGVVVETGEVRPGEPVVQGFNEVGPPVGLAFEDRSVLGALEFVTGLREDLRPTAVVELGEPEIVAMVGGYRIRLGRPTEMAAKGRVAGAIIDSAPEPGSEITLLTPERPAILEPSATTTTTTEPADDSSP